MLDEVEQPGCQGFLASFGGITGDDQVEALSGVGGWRSFG
jgi:hypothetical protein